MKMDRALQHDVLERLAKVYPAQTVELMDRPDAGPRPELSDRVIAALSYLQEHELVEARIDFGADGHVMFSGARITAKGLDFLEDDGGLSAVLAPTVIVKLHADTLRHLIANKIEASGATADDRSRLREKLNGLSGDALEAAVKVLVEKGLDHVGDLWGWLGTLSP